MNKYDIITWLEAQLEAVRLRATVQAPCTEGMRSTIALLKEHTELQRRVQELVVEKADLQKRLRSVVDGKEVSSSNLNNVYMPEEPTPEMCQALYGLGKPPLNNSDMLRDGTRRYKALRTILTAPPKPKTKTVWCLCATVILGSGATKNILWIFDTMDDANQNRIEAKSNPDKYEHVSPIWSEEVPV